MWIECTKNKHKIISDTISFSINNKFYEIFIITTPNDAHLYLNDTFLGSQGTYHLPEGTYKLEANKTGFKGISKFIKIPEESLFTFILE